MGLHAILYLIALFCFVVAAIGVPVGRVSLVAAGLAFWVLTSLV